ncbi:MAG: ATP-binding protein [Clostridiales bacterium]|nr:ATP-binding protein [Clostridiales bacterium]
MAKADLLFLDELSYLSFNQHQSELLFKVISERSEKSSTIVTITSGKIKVDVHKKNEVTPKS